MAAATSSSQPDSQNDKNLEAQIAALRADFTKLAETLNALGKEKADELKGKAAGKAQEAKSMSRDAMRAANEQARLVEAEVAGRVREHPFMALGVAAGLGFLAALIARR